MSETRILTLCPACVQTLEPSFRINKVPTATTTEKKRECEYCRKRYPQDILGQFTFAPRRR